MITGGIKFFNENSVNTENGSSVSVSTGDSSSDFLLDINAFTFWRSVGSDDLTTETITITMPSSQEIDRIFLIDHNFKNYNIKYDVSGTPTDFTNVLSINSEELANIDITDYDKNSSYYEFDAVTTNKIYIEIDTTQTVDAEKYISQVVITTEIGTLEGYPEIKVNKSKNAKKKKSMTGRVFNQKSIETVNINLGFRTYPSRLQSDIDTIMSLFDLEEPFLTWLCGGREGSDYFNYTLRGFRLKDLIKTTITNDFKDSYSKNIYTGLVNLTVKLDETP